MRHDELEAEVRSALRADAARSEPAPDALRAIRSRVGVSRAPRRRGPFWAVAAAGLAAAATITAVVVVSNHGGGSSPTGPPAKTANVVLYFVDQTQPGAAGRIFPERHQVPVPSGAGARLAAVNEFLAGDAADPDYASGWPSGVTATAVTTAGGTTRLSLTGTADLTRANGLSREQAFAAQQALLYTAGAGRQFAVSYNAKPLIKLFGGLVGTYQVKSPWRDVRPYVQIIAPADGASVSSPVTATVSGNVFEGNVSWVLKDGRGKLLTRGYVTTASMSWRDASIDLGHLATGRYTLTAFAANPGHPADGGRYSYLVDSTFRVR